MWYGSENKAAHDITEGEARTLIKNLGEDPDKDDYEDFAELFEYACIRNNSMIGILVVLQ